MGEASRGENRHKDEKGLYKLDEESIATVLNDLMQDYQTLANRHSEEMRNYSSSMVTTS